jgi:competence protein ComEC
VTSIYLFALVAGAWLLQQQAVLPGSTGATVLVPLAALWIFLARRSAVAIRALGNAVAIVTFAVAGFFWAAASASWSLADDLGELWEGRDVEISGVIAEMVQPNERGVRFVFDVEHAYTVDARIPSRISLMWYATGKDATPELHAGQRWRLAARLHRPHGNMDHRSATFWRVPHIERISLTAQDYRQSIVL